MSENRDVSVVKNHDNQISASRSYSKSQVALIKRTIAKDTTQEEFDMFLEICKRQGVDPFRRQIHALVFSKDDPAKRQVAFIMGIDGYRAIAKRTGNYRPDDKEFEIEYDESMKCPDTNPKGIKKATVTVWQYAKDGWYPIIGRALWEEFAPVKQESEWVDQYDEKGNVILQTEGRFKGRPKQRRVPKKDGNKWLEKDIWKTMPEHMIAKCAEAQALRKGWPEEMGAFYAEEEMHRAMAEDMTASEIIEVYEEEERIKAVEGYKTVPMIMGQLEGITMIPEGEMFDRCVEHIQTLESLHDLNLWKSQNRHGLNQYWAVCKGDAVELKKKIEARESQLMKEKQQ